MLWKKVIVDSVEALLGVLEIDDDDDDDDVGDVGEVGEVGEDDGGAEENAEKEGDDGNEKGKPEVDD